MMLEWLGVLTMVHKRFFFGWVCAVGVLPCQILRSDRCGDVAGPKSLPKNKRPGIGVR